MADKSNQERWMALALGVLIIVVLVVLIFLPGSPIDASLPIIRFLAAIAAGLLAFLIIGRFDMKGVIPTPSFRIGIQAAGGFATFILVFLLFYWGVPSEPSPEPSPDPSPSGRDIPTLPISYTQSEFQQIEQVIRDNLDVIGYTLIKGVQPGFRSDYSSSILQGISLSENDSVIEVIMAVNWNGGVSGLPFVNEFSFKIDKDNSVHDLQLLTDDGLDGARNIRGTEITLKDKLDDLLN